MYPENYVFKQMADCMICAEIFNVAQEEETSVIRTSF